MKCSAKIIIIIPEQVHDGGKGYLNWSSAQNIPLFLPMVLSLELMASTFPWAVQRTREYKSENIITHAFWTSECAEEHKGFRGTVMFCYLLLLSQPAQTLYRNSMCMGRWTWLCIHCSNQSRCIRGVSQQENVLVCDSPLTCTKVHWRTSTAAARWRSPLKERSGWMRRKLHRLWPCCRIGWTNQTTCVHLQNGLHCQMYDCVTQQCNGCI